MKRFTETEKWRDPWFRALSPVHKCFWQYLCDNCDHAGVVEIDWALVGFVIGQKVAVADLAEFSRQITILGTGKLWLRGFVRFQYGRLSLECKPHAKIFAALERHGITPEDAVAGVLSQQSASQSQLFASIESVNCGSKGIHTLSIGYQGTLVEEEEEEEEDKKKRDRGAEPLPFTSPAFIEAWSDWEKNLTEKRKPLKPTARRLQLKKLAAMGEARAVAALKHSATNQWTGLFEPDAATKPQAVTNSRALPASTSQADAYAKLF